MRYAYTVIIERTPRNYAAYAPDLPGCVATGASEGEAVRRFREAMRWHVESQHEQREPVPPPRCSAAVVAFDRTPSTRPVN